MTSTMIVECPRCGHTYQPSRDAIIAGVWRRACPICYPIPPRKDET